MAALLLAGGSIAACGGSTRSDGTVGPEVEAQEPIDATKPDATLLHRFRLGQTGAEIQLMEQRKPRPQIPVCNANPDPCCRIDVALPARSCAPE